MNNGKCLTVTDSGEGDFARLLAAGLAPAEKRFDH